MRELTFVVVALLVVFIISWIKANQFAKRQKRIKCHIKRGDIDPASLENDFNLEEEENNIYH